MTMTMMMMMMTDQVKRYLTVKRSMMMMTEQVKRYLTVKRSRDQDGHNAQDDARSVGVHVVGSR